MISEKWGGKSLCFSSYGIYCDGCGGMEALLQNMKGAWYKSLKILFIVAAEGLFRCCRF